MNSKKTEVVVLGAGPAGYVCAIRLAQLGKKVIVIEKSELGGVCLNRGCIPSKALIHAGKVYSQVKNPHELKAMGLSVEKPSLDFSELMKWKESIVKKLTGGVGSLLKSNGCEVIMGNADFISPHELKIEGHGTVHFEQLVIAVGSRPANLNDFPIDQNIFLDSTGALHLPSPPKSMICIGGGYIGLELGSFYSKIGTHISILEHGPHLLSGIDSDCASVVTKKLQKSGVDIFFNAKIQKVKRNPQSATITIQKADHQLQEITAEKVLVTVGRKPNTDTLNLKALGIVPDAKGFIPVNAQRQTSLAHIYAIGDVAGQPMLAHKGSKEGLIAAEAIAGKKSAWDVIGMPAVVFTDPEIATVGMTEQQAKDRGYVPQIGQFPYAANGRALSIHETEGFVKVIGDQKTGKLLGVHIVGAEASNLISEATLALEMGAQVEDLALTIHPHPTLSETLMEGAELNLGHGIHLYQKKKEPLANIQSAFGL